GSPFAAHWITQCRPGADGARRVRWKIFLLILVRRMNRVYIAALLIVPLAHGATWPTSVSFHELVEHPAKYNGKRVSVRAYVVTSCEHCGEFWESVKTARDSRVHDS